MRNYAAGAGAFLLTVMVLAVLPISSASAADCANEQLRAENNSTALPECRAYERVTPEFKNGGAFELPPGGRVADGPRVSLGGLGTFGGTRGTGYLGNQYEFTRQSEAWLTSPLTGPASEFVGSDVEFPMYTLGAGGTALFGLRTRSQPVDAESFYLWHAGALEEIGPQAPPDSLVGKVEQEIPTDENHYLGSGWGVSRDVSHVVYQLHQTSEVPGSDYLWPFDQTGNGELPSVYEYVGTHNTEPFLVAVTGGQGSTSLIGGCGAWLGSAFNLDLYNAVSADGSTVFVTVQGEDFLGGQCGSPVPAPEHTEVYARVDGETASAHTVSISEPSAADCAACQTATRSEATFAGASEDGSKVFFLTGQELLPGNPGRNLYEYDFDAPAGEKVTALSHMGSNAEAQVQGLVRVSQDGSHIYFVATGSLTAEPNGVGDTAQEGENNLYVADTGSGQVSFVATLSPADEAVWSPLALVRGVQATPDGRFLLFGSQAQITPDDTSTVSQLFRYDAVTGDLVRISIGEEGFNNNGNTSTDPATISFRFAETESIYQRSSPQRVMSDDGSRIFFESSNGLTPRALNHVRLPGSPEGFAQNIYEYRDGHVYLISDAQDSSKANLFGESSVKLLGTTSSGDDVFFTTVSPVVPGDKDTATDVYDARVGGGFATVSTSPCSGEACQGITGSPPSGQSPATSSFTGPGDPRPHHKKHRKRHKRKHHSKQHKAQTSRSAGSEHRGSK